MPRTGLREVRDIRLVGWPRARSTLYLSSQTSSMRAPLKTLLDHDRHPFDLRLPEGATAIEKMIGRAPSSARSFSICVPLLRRVLPVCAANRPWARATYRA
jgi:hypothetical protein